MDPHDQLRAALHGRAHATLRALGGLATGIDGAQDWDLVLRVAETQGRERIRHVPHVLYHWRELPGSTAAAAFEKPALVEAQRRVIAESLRRRGEAGEPRLTTAAGASSTPFRNRRRWCRS